MNKSDPIRQFLAELETSLSSNGSSPERILHEIEDHLRQQVEEFRSAGVERSEAELKALALFGTSAQVAEQFRQQPPLPCEEETMFRRSMTVLAAVTSIYAGLHVVFSLLNDPTALLTYVKAALALVVLAYGWLILQWQWGSRELSEMRRWAVIVGGLSLIEIGTANIVWTAHLGLVSGDWEYYGFVGGSLISMLGALAVIWFAWPLLEARRDLQPIA